MMVNCGWKILKIAKLIFSDFLLISVILNEMG